MQETGIREENGQKQTQSRRSRQTEQHTRFIIERGEANEHLDVDFSTAVDQQPEVLRRQVLQGILREYIQQTLPHCLQEIKMHVKIGVTLSVFQNKLRHLRWGLVGCWIFTANREGVTFLLVSVLLTWRGCSATTSILCSAYFLTYSYTLRGVTGMLTPPERSSTWTRINTLKYVYAINRVYIYLPFLHHGIESFQILLSKAKPQVVMQIMCIFFSVLWLFCDVQWVWICEGWSRKVTEIKFIFFKLTELSLCVTTALPLNIKSQNYQSNTLSSVLCSLVLNHSSKFFNNTLRSFHHFTFFNVVL